VKQLMRGSGGEYNTAMPHPIDYNLEEDFPNLAVSGWHKTSEPSDVYNCIAFSLHDTQQWWAYGAIRVRGYYWPPGLTRDDTVESWIEVFEIHGFQRCLTTDLEQGIEKVVIYVNRGEPQHITRQLENGIWISKLGPDEDIEHNTLEALVGDKYGKVEIIMKRPRVSKATS